MTDWTALGQDLGYSEKDNAPSNEPARMTLTKAGQALIKGRPVPVAVPAGENDNQGIRFAADVAARGAGLFAGWPTDTAQNVVNLGRAAIGYAPEAVRQAGFPNAANVIQGVLPRPDIANFSATSPLVPTSQNITQGYRNVLSLAGNPPQGVAPTGPAQDFAGNVGEMAISGLSTGLPSTVPAALRYIASMGGAETGRRVAAAAMPDSPVAQIAGQLLGGVSVPAAYATGGPVINTARALTEKGPQMAQDASARAGPVAESIINNTIQGHVAGMPQAVANIDEAMRLQKLFPGVKLSVAEMTGAPGLASMQTTFARLTPENLNAERSRLQNNIAVIRSELERRMPNAGNIPSEQLPGLVKNLLAQQEGELATVQKQLANSLSDTSQLAAGTALTDAANTERNTYKANVTRPQYERAFQLAGDQKIDASGVVNAAEYILGRKLSDFAPETAPNTVRMLAKLGGEAAPDVVGGGPASAPQAPRAEGTLKQLDDIRKAINADISQATSSSAPTSNMTLKNLGQLHQALDDAVRNSPLPDMTKSAYFQALQTYRDEYVPRFKTGVNADLFQGTRSNEVRLKPDELLSKYFQPGGEREATGFVSMFGKNQQALDTAKKGIIDLFREKVVDPNTGAIVPAKYESFMAKYRRPIDIMDSTGMGLRESLQSTGNEARQLDALRTSLKEKTGRLSFDSIEEMKSGLLKSPVNMGLAMQELVPAERKTLVRDLLNDAWKPVAEGGENSAVKFSDYLTKNERTLKQAMSSVEGVSGANKHFSDLRDMGTMLQMIQKANIKGGLASATGQDPLKAATNVSIATVWSQMRAVASNRQGVGTAIAMMAGPALTRLSQVQFNDVMNTALHDPKTALALKDFLMSPPTAAANKASSLLQIWNAAKATAKATPGFIAEHTMGGKNYPAAASQLAPTFAAEGAAQ